MRTIAAACLTMSLLLSACAQTSPAANKETRFPVPTLDDMRAVSPALAQYTQGTLLEDMWKRPDLSLRDRSIVTLAALIARNQTVEMPYHLNLALDNGVTPAEISEIITHLAFYSGWANATATVVVAKEVFAKRGIGIDQLPPANVTLLPVDKAVEARRAAAVSQNFSAVAPGVVHYTTATLFNDLWLRPGLAPRDRSLVTVTSLISSGQVAQVSYHLNRAMDNGFLLSAHAGRVAWIPTNSAGVSSTRLVP